MPCYRPVHAWRGEVRPDGKRSIVFRPHGKVMDGCELTLPCGSCVGCRLERARQWAMRCMDEASLYKQNAFVTLTFNEKHLPLNRSLDVSIFQKFMKRVRREVAPLRIRFFIVVNMGRSWVGRIIMRCCSIWDFRIGYIFRRPIRVKRFLRLVNCLGYGLLGLVLLEM